MMKRDAIRINEIRRQYQSSPARMVEAVSKEFKVSEQTAKEYLAAAQAKANRRTE